MSDPYDILFDRNTTTTTGTDIKKIAMRRFVNIICRMPSIDTLATDFDLSLLTEDTFIIGELKLPYLIINIPDVIHMDINLKLVLLKSVQEKKYHVTNLIIQHVDIYSLEPNVMELFGEHIGLKYMSGEEIDLQFENIFCSLLEMRVPLHSNDNKCVYMVAIAGKLDILKKIMKNYTFQNITEVTCKICAFAIREDHVHILQHFIPVETFKSIPDIIFRFITKTIEYGDNIKAIKYLLSDPYSVSIAQENYFAVTLAKRYQRINIIKYFAEIDPSIDHSDL